MIDDKSLGQEAEAALESRNIFVPELISLLETAETEGGVSQVNAQAFVLAFLQSFKWHERAQVSLSTYERLKVHHPLLADIVSFQGPHINHLTPRTLDIDAAQV